MITSRDPKDLLPRTASKVNDLIKACKAVGIDLLVTSTFRDAEAQDALYAKGRTAPGAKVTNVKGGDSFHQYRIAVDVVPIIGGKCIWDDLSLWARIGTIGTQCGLEWGGYWKSFNDKPHFQDLAGYSLDQYKRGEAK
jgi:peptidoglycan L-alanyl-D-glutamate endopeptidase CwlK